jgi:hypothetical protein
MTAEENYAMLLKELSDLLKIGELKPDAEGLVMLEVDGALPLYIQFAPRRETVILTCEIAQLSADTPARVFRTLLGAQLFDQGTGGGKFALDNSSDTLIFTYEQLLDGLPFASFREILENYIRCCEHWRKAIDEQTGGENNSGAMFGGQPGIKA